MRRTQVVTCRMVSHSCRFRMDDYGESHKQMKVGVFPALLLLCDLCTKEQNQESPPPCGRMLTILRRHSLFLFDCAEPKHVEWSTPRHVRSFKEREHPQTAKRKFTPKKHQSMAEHWPDMVATVGEQPSKPPSSRPSSHWTIRCSSTLNENGP